MEKKPGNTKPDISEKSQAKSQAKSRAKKSSEIQERMASVMNILRINPEITTPGIAVELGITERKVRTALEQLKKEQGIKFERSGRSGHWIID